MQRIFLFSSLLFAMACAGSSTQSAADAEVSEAPTLNADGTVAAQDGSRPDRIVLPEGTASSVSFLGFGRGKLQIGTSDGWVGTVQILNRKAEAKLMSTTGTRVATISPDADLVMLDSKPPQVVNQTGALILNLGMVPSLAAAAFAHDSFSLFVSEPGGKVRVWGQAHSFEQPSGDEKLENYLNKQASDFNVNFKPLAGPLYLMPGGSMIFGDQEGVISLWNPAKPSQSKRIMKLDGPVRSISGSGNELVATSTTGQLKAGKLDPPSFFGWARDVRGDFAGTSELLRGKFVEATEGTIRLRVMETGEVEWELPAPGKPCGVAVSEDGNFAAICLDHKVVVLSTRDGRWDSTVWVNKGLYWTAAGGQKIAAP